MSDFTPLEVSCIFPETMPRGGEPAANYGYRVCACGRYDQESQGLCGCGRDVSAPARTPS
jgi:hypothetical protein